MTGLIAASLLFLGIHLAVSGTTLRDRLTGVIGEKLYVPLFALASLVAVVWMCIAYGHARADDLLLFDCGQSFRNTGIIWLALAFVLFVPGVTRGNPTSAGQTGARIDGVLRITRHPFLCAVMLWSAFHLIGTGTLASAIFFGTFLVVAVIGTRAIDGKVRRKRPDQWRQIVAQTSILPFAAIIQGRNRFVAREYFDWRLALAVAIYAAILYFHADLFGVVALPVG